MRRMRPAPCRRGTCNHKLPKRQTAARRRVRDQHRRIGRSHGDNAIALITQARDGDQQRLQGGAGRPNPDLSPYPERPHMVTSCRRRGDTALAQTGGRLEAI